MGDPLGSVMLSVRGDARQLVSPDYAVLAAMLETARGSKDEALRVAATALDRLTADLASLGGVPFRRDTGRRPLTWSARSATTHVVREHKDRTGRFEPTGQIAATVDVQITIRALDKLDALGAALAPHDSVNVHQVSWYVDWDNPAWPEVRAAAIRAAIRKGRDYAEALGGSLERVEHIADVGLLGGDGAQFQPQRGALLRATSAGYEESDTPSLDPVPQELAATIEARFVAVGVSLSGEHPGPSLPG